MKELTFDDEEKISDIIDEINRDTLSGVNVDEV